MRSLLVPALLALIGCSAAGADFTLQGISPTDGASALGERVTFSGTGLDRIAKATVIAGSQRVELANVAAKDTTTASGEVAAGTPAGLYDVELTSADGDTVTLPRAFRMVDGELRIEIVNVGQGDGAYLQAPNGRAIVIDGGRGRSDTDSIVPTLTARGVTKPEMVLVTHFDSDHLGGIVDLLRGPDGVVCTADDRAPSLGLFDYAEALNTCASNLCLDYYKLRDCNAPRIAGGAGHRVPAPGETLHLGGGVALEVVALNGLVAGGVVVPTGSDNSNSIALLLRFGKFRYFTAGDLTGGLGDGCNSSMDNADVESAVAKQVGQVDVLHVNHHGSCTSSNAAFIRSLAPLASVISVGENNPYGHPDQGVLDRVAQASKAVFLTSPGITSGTFPKTKLPANAEPKFGSIRLRTKDGARFTVDVLGTDGTPSSTREFEVR